MMKRAITIILSMVLLVALCACSGSGNNAEIAQTRASDSIEVEIPNVTDMALPDAIKMLEDAGFENVYDTPDASSDSFMVIDRDNWIVVKQLPLPGEMLNTDDEVTLYCLKKTELESSEESTPSGFSSLVGGPLSAAISSFAENGYTPTYIHGTTLMDFTSEVSFMEEPFLSEWVVTDVYGDDPIAKTIEVKINNVNNMARMEGKEVTEEVLERKLDAYSAREAVNAYGSSAYPYGFKAHWIMDLIAQEPSDENTWFLKVGCDVKNAYGAKETGLVCEAYVTGTTDNPVVVSFNVY